MVGTKFAIYNWSSLLLGKHNKFDNNNYLSTEMLVQCCLASASCSNMHRRTTTVLIPRLKCVIWKNFGDLMVFKCKVFIRQLFWPLWTLLLYKFIAAKLYQMSIITATSCVGSFLSCPLYPLTMLYFTAKIQSNSKLLKRSSEYSTRHCIPIEVCFPSCVKHVIWFTGAVSPSFWNSWLHCW